MRRISFLFLALLIVSGCAKVEPIAETNASPDADASANVAKKASSLLERIAAADGLDNEAAKQIYSDIKQEFQDEIAALEQKIDDVETQEAKLALLQQTPLPAHVARLIAASQKFVSTPTGVDIALDAMGKAKGSSKDEAMHNVLDHFLDRVSSKKIVNSLLESIPAPQTEAYFTKIISKETKPEYIAHALLVYSAYVDRILPYRNALASNPALVQKMPDEQMEYINSPRTDDQVELLESRLQLVIDKYGDLRRQGSGTFGAAAKADLYELKNLSIGMVAPDIVGEDLDGIKFKLSDYRGKVVMLDFWGHWCPPCQQMYPHEQQLVEKLASAPFVLLGVNSDQDKQTAIDAVNDDDLAWRNFWDGPSGTSGPISKQWNISAWPTVYLIDQDGVIRHKNILGEDLNRNLQALLAESGHEFDLAGIE